MYEKKLSCLSFMSPSILLWQIFYTISITNLVVFLTYLIRSTFYLSLKTLIIHGYSNCDGNKKNIFKIFSALAIITYTLEIYQGLLW